MDPESVSGLSHRCGLGLLFFSFSVFLSGFVEEVGAQEGDARDRIGREGTFKSVTYACSMNTRLPVVG